MKILVRVAILLLLTVLLASCGGGSVYNSGSSSDSGNGNSNSNNGNTNGGSNNTCSSSAFTMGAETFCADTITITQGATITFVNAPNSGTPHILVIGMNGQSQPEQGAPTFGTEGHTVQPGEKWATPSWDTPGTYHVSCVVHPTTMNLTVIVTSNYG